ncbi:MAG: hypothetical protein LBR81_00995 [Prevotellaceae bacterium]|jgi:hypothetical protein|nr:hypothetical protein [Prevotellaceae bacterium]
MTKIKITLSLLALFCLFSFSSTDIQNGLLRGDKLNTNLPELQQAVKQSKGSFVLINSWASHNASARMENIRFARLLEKHKKNDRTSKSFCVVSLSFDQYESIFTETIKQDALSSVHNVFVSGGFEAELAKLYNIDRQDFGNFLLDEQGVIIAKNITAKELESILQSN